MANSNATKLKGFGVSLQDGKTQINKRKRPDLFVEAGSDAINQHHFLGSDAAAVPESTSIAPPETTPANSQATTPASPSNTVPVDQTTGLIQVHPDELQRIIADAAQRQVQAAMASRDEQIVALRTSADEAAVQANQRLQAMQDEVARAAAEAARVQNILNVTGTSIPVGDSSPSGRYGFGVNTLILPSMSEPKGAAKDFLDMLGNSQYTPKQRAFDASSGTQYEQLDTSYLDKWLRDPNNRKHAIRDFEPLFKANGLLTGADMGMDAARAGSTLGGSLGSIREAFLPFLSAMMRTSHVARYVWHQFVTVNLELGRVPGTNMLVPRFEWLDEPTNPLDYLLDSVDATATISNESQALIGSSTPIDLFGYGLGLGGKVGTRPIAIGEFISRSSMIDLLDALESRLGQNYNGFEDLMIRSIFQQTLNNASNVYYNEGGQLTLTPTNINIGEDGTLTEEALNSMFSEMTSRRIPTFDNGLRVGVLNTKGAAQFKNSLGDKLRANTETEIQDITSILNAGGLGSGFDKPSGYIGTYCNFMLFESGTIGIGSPGAAGAEGVYNTTFGAGARVTRDNFFFGPGVCGKGTSLPMEIRGEDGSSSFGTKMRFIWRSIEGWGSLDCTSTNANQQDRVLVLRTADQVI